MIGNINITKEILKKHNVSVKKRYGQNFLIDMNILNKIIAHSETSKNTEVIEIGPGIGSLTELLALNSKTVLAYEIDKQMVDVLNDTLKGKENVIVICEDFLKADLVSDINKCFNLDSEKIVVANLPYYITTPIIMKLIDHASYFSHFVLMMQKEVAERLTAKPKTKAYNSLSVAMEYLADVEKLFNVSKGCFLPQPQVESVVIKITPRNNKYSVKDEKFFLEFNKAIFSQKRKTLANNLSSFYKIEKDKINNLLVENNYKATIRAEDLAIHEIINLSDLFEYILNP